MSAPSLALARKYRPRNFSELMGQEHVVRALANALTQQRLGWKPTQLGLIADISRPGYFG